MRIQELLEHQTLDEMPLPSEWKEDELSGDRTFKHRLEYVLARAARLGAGSARVAVTVEYGGRNTVIKIAKNRRGVAQNAAEVGVLTDGYLGKLPIVIPLIDYDRRNAQPTWIQTELAQRVSARKLTNLLGCTQLWDLTDAVNYVLGNKTPLGRELGEIISDLGEEGKSRSDIDRFVEYVDEVAKLVSNSSLLVGDLQRAANWGEWGGRPVIIDLGFTEEVKHLYIPQRR